MYFFEQKSRLADIFFTKIYIKAPVLFDILFDFSGLFCAAVLYAYNNKFFSILLLISAAMIHTLHMLPLIRKNSLAGYVLTLVFVALTSTGRVIDIPDHGGILWVIFPYMADIYRYIFLLIFFGAAADDKRDALYCALPAFALCFIVFFYLPCETFINSFGSFGFFFGEMLPYLVRNFITSAFLIAFIVHCFPPALRRYITSLIIGITAAVYIQYMFMNTALDKLGMARIEQAPQPERSVLNAAVWIFIISLPFILQRLKTLPHKRLSVIFPAFILLLHIFSLSISAVLTKEDIFGTNNKFYMSSEEMYTVSPQKNVIVLVYDAADNYRLDELRRSRPEVFDGLEDFTVYTNTCSVYDYTTLSFMTMFGGLYFDPDMTGREIFDTAWDSPKTHKFYDALHGLNYKINAFNMSGGSPENWIGLFDNANERERPVKYKLYKKDGAKIERGMRNIGLYRALPLAAKVLIDTNEIDFRNAAQYYNTNAPVNYDNSEFLNNLKLKAADTDKNYFIIQHTSGLHYPLNDDDEFAVCMDITRQYVKQLKKLGVYDDSVIIVTSDHGEHTLQEDSAAPFAATPILMIKRAGESRSKYALNNAPVYFTDLLSTFAQDAGLEKKQAVADFGPSVYDIPPEKPRQRTWYDRHCDKSYPNAGTYGMRYYISHFNTFYAYTYTGDRNDLEKAVKDPKKLTIYPIKEFID